MKHFLLVIDSQEGFMVDGITDHEGFMINTLLENNCFDCVISSVYQNFPESNIIKFMGWDKLLTEQEQQVTEIVAEHTHFFVKKSTYSAYSDELVEVLKNANEGKLPECVFIVGFDIECCVLMTAVDLFEHGIRPIVLTQYCGASGGEEARFAGIRTLKSLIGTNNICYEEINTPSDLDRVFQSAEGSAHSSSDASQKKAHRVIERLQKQGWRISFAESCTGGKVAAGIVDVPSASSVLDCSFVTYANEAKINLLDVCAESINNYGVVSEQVAGEMAEGAAKKASAQVGVGVSGIAGPGGATANKPVGLVCFGFYINGEVYTRTAQFGNIGRNSVRQASVDFVYDTLLDLLPAEEL